MYIYMSRFLSFVLCVLYVCVCVFLPYLVYVRLMCVNKPILTCLDLVPPVLIRTLGNELSPSGTVVGSISRVIRINTQCVQILLQCVLPCPLWSSDPPPATSGLHIMAGLVVGSRRMCPRNRLRRV